MMLLSRPFVYRQTLTDGAGAIHTLHAWSTPSMPGAQSDLGPVLFTSIAVESSPSLPALYLGTTLRCLRGHR